LNFFQILEGKKLASGSDGVLFTLKATMFLFVEQDFVPVFEHAYFSSVTVCTALHLVPKSRVGEAIPPLPQYTFMTWCPVEAQGQLYLYYCTYL
jgi:hypothetical protein